MTAVADLIEQTRVEYLQGGLAERRNLLDQPINTTDTTLTLKHNLGPIAQNSRVCIGLEDMHVYQVVAASKSIVVTRGDYGTTAASHAADDVVLVGSAFTNSSVLNAFNDTLSELQGRGLYAIDVAELTYIPGTLGYDLTSTPDLIEVIDVATRATHHDDWHRLSYDEWFVIQAAETDDFASGSSLHLHRGASAYAGQQLRVWYRADFTDLTTLAQDATASGLESTAEDLLKLGAAVRLSAGIPLRRNSLDFQPDPRRAEEVPAGANLAAPQNLRRVYERRMRDELHRLDARYPVRLRSPKANYW